MQESSPVIELGVDVYESKTKKLFWSLFTGRKEWVIILLKTEILFLMRNNSESGLKNSLWRLGNKFGL